MFDVTDSKQAKREPIEIEISDRREARQEVIALLAGMAHEALPDGDDHEFSAVISDESGTKLFEASLRLKARWLVPEDQR
jgi:hypothetical protein